jgi:endoglucanase
MQNRAGKQRVLMPKIRNVCFHLSFALLVLVKSQVTLWAADWRGVNLAGGEFNYNPARVSDIYGKHYIYPAKKELQYFSELGATVIRLPIRWERIQPRLNTTLDAIELERIGGVIADAQANKLKVIIDIHNFGKHKGRSIGSPNLPTASFIDLWQRLSDVYGNNPTIIFGLMNEPFDIPALVWAKSAQSTLLEIRKRGARNLVLVPGTAWSGAHSWLKPMRGESNANAFADFRDPANNMAFDFHQYFDTYSSGTTPDCITPAQALKRISVATNWLKAQKRNGFLSEFAVSGKSECQAVMKDVLQHLSDNREWIGWTYWASSPWFGDYMFNVYPAQQIKAPQLETLQPFLRSP